ncbi:MAG: TPM domain-containing protein [Ruminococcaceae bacterium]|nr:TPM domain-containing protein [Oscillospiraceae bacterium]
MKKQLGILLFTLLLILGMTLSASAASMPRLVDGADLLSDSEEAELLSMLDEISARQMLDVVIVTTNTLEGKSAMAYADDFFDYNGYGFGSSYDGVLLLVSMEDRDWWISTSGYGITAFTDYGITCLSDQFLPDLGNGFYADAFETFARGCDEYITLARNGTPFDVGSEPFDPGSSFLIAAVIGLIAALIVVSSMKAQLKTVRQQNAGSYLKDGSFQLTESREMFLYRNVHRTVKQESSSGGSSTHRSSCGRSHGGGGGKF